MLPHYQRATKRNQLLILLLLLLYVTTLSKSNPAQHGADYIRQYNLISTDILLSATSIIIDNPLTDIKPQELGSVSFVGMQIGMDGKIYQLIPGNNKTSFLVINQPNKKGFDCQIRKATFDFISVDNYNPDGLPNFMESYFNGLLPTNTSDTCPASSINVFPNPVYYPYDLFFEFECITSYDLDIYSTIGQKIYSEAGIINGKYINIKNLANGMYIFKFKLEKNIVFSRKIIKN